jgi:4-oxalocrotonate tautomerase
MPFINIKMAPGNYTAQQKEQVIAGVTKVLADVLGKDPAATSVLIEEYPLENWGKNGQSLASQKK